MSKVQWTFVVTENRHFVCRLRLSAVTSRTSSVLVFPFLVRRFGPRTRPGHVPGDEGPPIPDAVRPPLEFQTDPGPTRIRPPVSTDVLGSELDTTGPDRVPTLSFSSQSFLPPRLDLRTSRTGPPTLVPGLVESVVEQRL